MKLHIFGCGGTGINALYTFMKTMGEDKYTGIAEIVPHYVDTSIANAEKKNLVDVVKLIQLPARVSDTEERDGSGKSRVTHYEEIRRQMPEVIAPIGFNDAAIFISSGSGGSGSIMAQVGLMLSHQRDRIATAITVNAYDDAKSRQNCMDSMLSMEKMTRNTKKPSVVFLTDNENGEAASDKKVQDILKILAIFFSGKNERLDTSDMANFLNFPKVTDIEPRLVFVSAYIGCEPKEIAEAEKNAIAVASLYRSEVLKAPVDSEYSTHGIFDSNIVAEDIDSLHLVISGDRVEDQFKEVQQRVFNDEARRKKQAGYSSFANSFDTGNDDDLVVR